MDRVDRLRALLGSTETWEAPSTQAIHTSESETMRDSHSEMQELDKPFEPFMLPDNTQGPSGIVWCSDSDDDEKVLNSGSIRKGYSEEPHSSQLSMTNEFSCRKIVRHPRL